MKNLLLSPLFHLERKLTFKPTSEDHGGLPRDHEKVTFGQEFGLSLDGAFVRGSSNLTVLFVHGNRYNLTKFKEQYDFFDHSQLSYFTFDYPGYGQSQGMPSEQGAYAAVRAAYLHLMYARGVQQENLIVYGLSLGAALAADLLLNHTARGFIAECPFTNSWTMAKHLYPSLPIWWIFPNRFRNDVKFPQLSLPIFLFHGLVDTITPWSCSQELFESCTAPKRLRLVQGAGHNDSLIKGGAELQLEINNWMREPS